MAMNLADQMLLAQLRESALQSVPDDQWNLVLNEVEKAGGVRQVQGYAKTLLHDAITKASFGGNRSDAGRYAANVRWQGQDKADRAKIDREDEEEEDRGGDYIDDWNEKNPDDYFSYDNPERDFRPQAPKEELKESNTAGAKIKTVDKLKKNDIVRVDDKIIVLDSKPMMLIQGKIRINGRELESGQRINIETDRNKVEIGRIIPREELKEGNMADELPSSTMPPEYNDYGDEPSDTQRAGRKLMRMAVPLDTKNPEKSRVKTSSRRP